MRIVVFIFFCLMTFAAFGQSFNKKNTHKYFVIKGTQQEYEGKIYKNIYPALKKDTFDFVSRFLHQYPRRFEYILTNKTNYIYGDSSLKSLFPDTTLMSQVFNEKLGKDKATLSYLNHFIAPHKNLKKRIEYTQDELMSVASRFFYCESVQPDSSIFWHLCIGINGQEEAGWKKDFTLLEAFCFEAIFDRMFDENEQRPAFMGNFESYIDKGEVKYKGLPLQLFLEKIRDEVFVQMANDNELKQTLLNYYENTKDALPFVIQ